MIRPLTGELNRLKKFVLVGAVGFIIDASILTILSTLFDYNVYGSRLVSFSFATFVTWQLNRTFAFKHNNTQSKKMGEYGRYLTIQITGALINLSVFSVFIATSPALRSIPVIPLFFGASVALVFNYLGAKYWVFTEQETLNG